MGGRFPVWVPERELSLARVHFPNIVRIVSRTQRYETNCDYGVIFEHPVTKEEVFMEMKKAFASLHTDFAFFAITYEKFILNGCV